MAELQASPLKGRGGPWQDQAFETPLKPNCQTISSHILSLSSKHFPWEGGEGAEMLPPIAVILICEFTQLVDTTAFGTMSLASSL